MPEPKSVTFSGGPFKVPRQGWIVLDLSPPFAGTAGFNIAEQLAAQLEPHTGVVWNIVRDAAGVDGAAEIRCRFDKSIVHEQGYGISISPAGVVLRARAAVGLYYAMRTLVQIVSQCRKTWPGMEVADTPDFDRRGVYHDCARGKVPELGTLLQLIDDLAGLKINEFQLYVENAYAFRRHPAMWRDTTPFTGEELMMLDAYCKARFIDFVPSLTSLGHFEKILGRPEYRHLGEAEPDDLRKQGMKVSWDAPWTLNVSDPASMRLLKEMYDEYLPNFTSGLFNICCDESWDLGKGKSRRRAEKIGTGQLYVDWINTCAKLAKGHGKSVMLWGDIIRDHPDKLRQLPKDAILLEWGYEADHDFDGRLKAFAKAGRRFYVCPGTSAWQTLTGRSANALANGRAAAVAGVKHGAAGYLMTDWGDFGHQQMLAVSLVPMAYGAAISWNAGSADEAILAGVSRHFFGDKKGTFAKLVVDLGMMYERVGAKRPNAAVEFWLFREPWEQREYLDRVKVADVLKMRQAAEKCATKLGKVQMKHPDAELIVAELMHSANVVRHTADRTLARKEILAGAKPDRKALRRMIGEAEGLRDQFVQLWNARNKTSRMMDAVAEWERLIGEYRGQLG